MSRHTAILETIRSAQQLLPEAERPLYDFYLRLLTLLYAYGETLPAPTPPADVAARLAAAMPALRWDDLGVEPECFLAWLGEVAALFESQDAGVRDEMDAIEPSEWLPLARQWVEQGESGAGPTIDALIGNALAPYLEVAAAALAPALPSEWLHSTCPACGGYANFALVDDRKRRRTCTCERCATMWRYNRTGCLFCGERHNERFGYYSSEDELYRVEVCDSCGLYLKAMDSDEAQALGLVPLPEAERVMTPGLDVTALEAGYQRPTRLPAA